MPQKIDVTRVLNYALQMEKTGREFFVENSKKFSHGAVTGIFEQLALEEEKHIDFLKTLIAGASKGQEVSVNEAFRKRTGDFFSLRADSEKLDQTVLESMIPACTVLRTAYLIERDFAEFYEGLAKKTDGKLREALLMLARWERGHEKFIQGTHDRLFDQYIQMPWGG